MHRFTEAEAELLEAHEGYVETCGNEDKRTIGAVKSLTDLYDAWHEAEPSRAYDTEAAAWRAKLPAPEQASSLIKLGMRLLEEGRYAAAEAPLGECLEIRQEALPEGHWLIFNTMSVLGECIAGATASSSGAPGDPSLTIAARIEKLREAEPLLLDSYAGLTENAEAIPDAVRTARLRQALERIVRLYETWHAAEPDDDGGHGRDAHATTNAHATKAAEWRAVLEGIEGSGDRGIKGKEPATQPGANRP